MIGSQERMEGEGERRGGGEKGEGESSILRKVEGYKTYKTKSKVRAK